MKTALYWLVGFVYTCTFLCFVGCTGSNLTAGRDARPPGEIVGHGSTSPSPLFPNPYSQFPSPTSLPLPEGVEAELWEQLTAELERQLIELRGASRVGGNLLLRSVSTPPLSNSSKTLLSKTGSQLQWNYFSNGDYDQNSEVNLADLAQLALHFQESAWPLKFSVNSIGGVVDGDSNGEINLADITPIALNFQNNVASYKLYRSKNSADYPAGPGAGNGSADVVSSHLYSTATGDRGTERLQFSSLMPEAYKGDYFWVRPVDNEGAEGTPSSLAGPYTNIYSLEGYVFMAGGGTDPLPGVQVELYQDSTLIASTVTNEFGHYSFDGLLNGNYTITPTGDPFGYAPETTDVTISNADKYISPIYPAPVNIVRRWALDDGTARGSINDGDLKIDAEGNVFITDRIGHSDVYRFYLLKYDMFGELLWSQAYELPYGLNLIKIHLLPSGEIYLRGQYSIVEPDIPNADDLYVMKLDSSGNIIWDFAFNYPSLDLTDHYDAGYSGYVDFEDNLHIVGYSSNQETFEEQYQYILTISPEGNLLEQARLEPSSATHHIVHLTDFEFDPQGGLLVSGTINGDYPAWQALLMRMTPAGEVDWINNWGGFNVTPGDIEVGPDGFIYNFFRGYPPGNNAERGLQMARYDSSGIRDWEILCTIEDVDPQPEFGIGPQGKLWLAGDTAISGTASFTNYMFIWSFQPVDGSLRFSRLWECDDVDIGSGGVTRISGMEVNQYGVAVLTGTTRTITGEWVEHAVTIQDTSWEMTHGNSFSFNIDDPPAELRELPVSQIPEVGMVDPPVSTSQMTFIMLYRP